MGSDPELECRRRESDVKAKMPESTDESLRRYSNTLGARLVMRLPPGSALTNSTRSCGFFTGRALSSMTFMTLNMAVFAPIPSASVMTVTAAKPGLRRNLRHP
jgi:hypothetical protein